MTNIFNSDGYGIEEVFVDDETTDPNEKKADTVSKTGRNTGLVSALKPVTINMPEISIMPTTWSTINATLVDDKEEIPAAPRLEVHCIYSSSLASDPGEPKGYAAAMKGNGREMWVPAMKSEITNKITNGKGLSRLKYMLRPC